jgi:hypothetical protein
VPIDHYLATLRQIWQRAQVEVFTGGTDANAVTLAIAGKYRDILNSFGYNPGWFGQKAPVTDPARAWWLPRPASVVATTTTTTTSVPSTSNRPVATVVAPGQANIYQLYEQYKGLLRCSCGNNKLHSVGGKKELRLRCSRYPQCKETYREGRLRMMVAGLQNTR